MGIAIFMGLLILVLALVALGIFVVSHYPLSRDNEHRAYAQHLRYELAQERELLLRSHRRGELSAQEFQKKEEGLAQRLLDERAMPDGSTHDWRPRWVKSTMLGSVVVLALAVAAIYPWVGDVSSLSDDALDQREAMMATRLESPDFEATIATLEAQVKKDPSNEDAWRILAEHYRDTEDITKALHAYQALYKLHPNDVNILSDVLDMTVAAQNGALTGDVPSLVDAGLKLDPMAPRFLLVAAPLAHQAGDFDREAQYWKRLLTLIPPLDPGYDVVQQRLGLALQRAGLRQAPADPVLEAYLKATQTPHGTTPTPPAP